jgi:aldehyde:ferredoxin oxidoreductase
MAGGDAHVAAAIETEDRAAVMDSMILCKFLRGVFEEPYPEWAHLLSAVSGWDVDGDELEATARRVVLAKRAFNAREGWTRADDTLPDRFLSESLPLGSGREAALTSERLESMIRAYYAARGLTDDGLPNADQLADLQLEALVH